MKKLAFLSATSALILPSAAFAQSTGSIEVEGTPTIVVTGSRVARGVDGIVVPDAPRAQGVLTNEYLQTQAPGQSVLQAINIIPGVNFTQTDPYGSSGGNLRVRGFEGNRISLTWDGMPLNDTGNYAIFSNQQLDSEIIDQVNVNLGQTEVDSPTASAAGGTVNYRTVVPRRELGGRIAASIGDHEFRRVFGMIETGELTTDGLRGLIAASVARNDLFRGPGEIYKQQFNARLYQDLGGGDFIAIGAHYNRNRNNFYRNPNINDLRTAALLGPARVPATAAITPASPLVLDNFSDVEVDNLYGFGNDPQCLRPTPGPGAQNESAICANYFNLRINPSDTGNIRINSRFTLADNLILTIDPSFQYTLANGGGTSTLAENSSRARGSSALPGVDFNGDGDVSDTVRFYTPNNTNTRRFGLTTSLIWDVADNHRLRLAYTFDRGRHRQTGEWGFLDAAGNPEGVFGGRIDSGGRPVLTADGFQLQQRDRLSIALLNQISGQYVGRFFEDRLRVEVGLRMPFFKRDLQTFCPIEARGSSGFAYCTSEPIPFPGATGRIFVAPGAAVPATGPTPYYAPFRTEYSFNQPLPNVGFVYNFTNNLSVFGSYAKGFSAPRTDNLYRAPIVEIEPETTDAFDLGVRYRSGNIQAQATAWYINFQNRIISSFDADQGISVDRNVGAVESYGLDATIAWQPNETISLLAFASYINAEFQDDVAISTTNIAPTAGKMVPETPEWQVGGRAQFEFGPVTFGIEGKYVGERFATDVNDVVVGDYITFDSNLRFSLEPYGLERTYVQVNAFNLFDERYIGNIGTQINAAGNPNFTPGSPRTFSVTLNVGF